MSTIKFTVHNSDNDATKVFIIDGVRMVQYLQTINDGNVINSSRELYSILTRVLNGEKNFSLADGSYTESLFSNSTEYAEIRADDVTTPTIFVERVVS